MALTVKKREKISVENTPCEWRKYADGVSFELYALSNPLYMQAMATQERRDANVDILDLDEEQNSLEMQVKIVGRYLVKDWKGIVDEQGEPLALTPDSFVDLVVADSAILGWIVEQAAEIAKQQKEYVADTKKKSSNVTSGKSNTAS